MVHQSNNHVALLSSPGLGHLIPTVELAKRLVADHGCTITLFAVTTEGNKVEDELLQAVALSLPSKLFNAVVLPVTAQATSHLEPDAALLTRLLAMVSSTLPTLRSTIFTMKPKPLALVVDLFCTEAIKIAEEFNMNKYAFIASNAQFLAYTLYLPHLKGGVKRGDPLCIPGCKTIQGDDLPQHMSNPQDKAYQTFVQLALELTTADGILVNTWHDLEAKTLNSFNDEKAMKHIAKVPIYSIGPIIREAKQVGDSKKTDLFEWLDRQADDSVLYVSFGSGGTLSAPQTIEIARGLELSKQRFIWVFRPPTENDNASSFFNQVQGTNELSEYLPEGFLERTRDIGIVVPKWAPQEDILAHRAVGGFVCHCGWNSTLESIVHGVPIIAWPLYAEQDMNATMLVKEIGIAVRSEVKPTKGVVKREEIAKLVRRVMVDEDGLEIRSMVKELKVRAHNVLSKDGSSFSALARLAQECEKGHFVQD